MSSRYSLRGSKPIKSGVNQTLNRLNQDKKTDDETDPENQSVSKHVNQNETTSNALPESQFCDNNAGTSSNTNENKSNSGKSVKKRAMTSAERKRKSRENKSPNSRQRENEYMKKLRQEKKKNETIVEKCNRLKQRNDRDKHLRENQSQEEAEQRKQKYKEQMRVSRENESQDKTTQKKERKKKNQQNLRKRRRSKDDQNYKAASDWQNVEFYQLGKMSSECKYCNAKHFKEEQKERVELNSFSDCCNNGKIQLEDPFKDYPDDWRSLFVENYPGKKAFYDNIVSLNSSFSFESLCSIRPDFRTPGPPCYRIQGRVYHTTNVIAKTDGNDEPTNGQLFFYDSNDAIGKRTNRTDCPIEIISKIETRLREDNPFAEGYFMLKEVEENEENLAKKRGEKPKEIKLAFELRDKLDTRRYNVPTANEVAAIFVVDAAGEIPAANVVVHQKGKKQLKTIPIMSKVLEPMTYPLFYPNGNEGWNEKLKNNEGKIISMCDYASYKIGIRDTFNPLHHGKMLFQQWAVDHYTKVEQNNLNYIRQNQNKLKAASYTGLQDYMNHEFLQNNGCQKFLASTDITL